MTREEAFVLGQEVHRAERLAQDVISFVDYSKAEPFSTTKEERSVLTQAYRTIRSYIKRMQDLLDEEYICADKTAFFKEKYPAGTRICVDCVDDESSPIKPDSYGEVLEVDDNAVLHVKFDDGRVLEVDPREVTFFKVAKEV